MKLKKQENFKTVPHVPQKLFAESIVNPENMIKLCFPQAKELFKDVCGVIICYNRRLMCHIKKQYQAVSKNCLGCDALFFEHNNKSLAVVGNFGIGAPAAVVILELLIACKVELFISVGVAGALEQNLLSGNVVLCTGALRDEGTSHHYLPCNEFALPSDELTSQIQKTMLKKGIAFVSGQSWTIDSPYRETREEVSYFSSNGIKTVEMEASALFAVAKYRKIKLGAAFVISDSLADSTWKPAFRDKKVFASLTQLAEVAIEALSGCGKF